MAVSENETERWPRRHSGGIGALMEPTAAPDSSRLSPVPSLGSTDHVLHLHGRADSAYSSFSGGSNVPEYHTPSCYEADCCSASEQVPYMDSEYVRGIYNLSAASSALRCLQPCQAPAQGIPASSHSPALAECSSGIPSRGTLDQGLLPPAAPPPSPPMRLDSYRVTRHLESTKGRGRRNSGGLSECSVQQSAPSVDSQPAADRCASCAVPPAQPCGNHISTPSSHDPRGDGCQNHEDRDGVVGSSLCQHGEEPAASSSIPSPRKGSRDDAQIEKKSRSGSQTGSALTTRPELQPKASSAAAAEENVASCLVLPAQPQQGDGGAAPGQGAKEAAAHSGRGGDLQEGETDLPQRRLCSPEDRRYEELAMALIAKDSSLVDVLMPYPVRKTALDLMEGLFPVNVSVLEMHRRKADLRRARENDRKSSGDVTEECPESELTVKQRSEDPTGKGDHALGRSADDTKDLDDITCKKLELISSLRAKVRVLAEDRELILAEAKECAERGEELEAAVRAACKPNEFERYLMFIGDLEKVVSLLLCLSSRLARVQNAMRKIDGNTDAEEKQSLNERHKLLSRQREDAKDLKENLDRRERVVAGILAKYLTDQQLQAYRHFVQLKTSLLIEQRDLEEQIKFFEEQLENLEKSIPL
ncbi:protein Shroom1 isoform X3 [Centrocercus urophasianus]|uniref:protein Shroom1 isoform X3 n=1 Tax=Centrocercus urophasianus TaxID=9002 RepID=UPI001C645568|nr:protein Shroom1 isoform X3 [Centrocercus urophasianus]